MDRPAPNSPPKPLHLCLKCRILVPPRKGDPAPFFHVQCSPRETDEEPRCRKLGRGVAAAEICED